MKFDAYFCASPLAAHRHERRGGGSVEARLIRCWTPAHESVDPATDDLVVGLMLGGHGAARWAWDGAAPNIARARRRGALGLTPPGARGRFEVEGASGMLIVALPLAALRARLAPELDVPSDFGALHDVYADHPRARALCHRLWRAAGGGRAADPLVDAVAEDLLIEFCGLAMSGAAPRRAYALDARDLARLHRCVESAECDVAALAKAVAMPVRTFRRSFQQTFGVAPHRWLTAQRLAAAAVRLSSTGQPIADIAVELGFASQAHLTERFRRAYGVAPGLFRRQAEAVEQLHGGRGG